MKAIEELSGQVMSLHIECNPHKEHYQSIADYLKEYLVSPKQSYPAPIYGVAIL